MLAKNGAERYIVEDTYVSQNFEDRIEPVMPKSHIQLTFEEVVMDRLSLPTFAVGRCNFWIEF